MALLFGFAWVDPTSTTWQDAYYREDEKVYSLKIDHQESKFPLATIQIKNPQIGLLAPGRQTWAWISFFDENGLVEGTPGQVVPIFFGQLVGVPDDLLGAVVTLKFIARSLTFISDKQIAAEPLKVRPGYDAVFLPLEKRDDPDTILEGYSSSFHYDRTTLATTVSDWLVGEDGVEIFQQTDAFFDSVKVKIGQQPLTAVAVFADVEWQQEWTQTVDFGSNTFDSYSGDGIVNEWPKPLASLGAGWSCFTSIANDEYGIATALTASYGFHYDNPNKTHQDGDTLTISGSVVSPQIQASPKIQTTNIFEQIVIGLLDPFATDLNGDPAPVNQPASIAVNSVSVPIWRVNTSLVLRADVSRKRTEHVSLLLQSNLQPILANPTVQQYSELIKKSGKVGVPIFNLLNWSSIAGQEVAFGQLVFPDNPTLPGQISTQIAIVGGIAGTSEPIFSNTVGDVTQDGSVQWSSLGVTPPPENAPDWHKQTATPLGQMLTPRQPFFTTYADIIAPGLAARPQIGASISFGQIIQGSNGVFVQCTLSGITGITQAGGSAEPTWPSTPGTVVNDGSVQWTVIGTAIPDGTTTYIATTAGTTDDILPEFDPTQGNATTDGSVVWTSLGQFAVPAGGSPGNITARAYFPTDRGAWSIEYLISLARAALRRRARAINVSWDCRFERAVSFSCRKSATLFDFRLPGGVASGKIIAYTLKADGDKGELIGNVTIGCSVGLGDTVAAVAGDPNYVEDDYVGSDYQVFDGQIVTINDEVGYSPAVYSVNDDGLVYPISKSDAVVVEALHGDLTSQEAGIQAAFTTAKNVRIKEYTPQYNYGQPGNAYQSIQLQELEQKAALDSLEIELRKAPIWYELQLKPLTNGPYDEVYNITTTTLAIPQTIDLSATSTA